MTKVGDLGWAMLALPVVALFALRFWLEDRYHASGQ